MTNNSKATTDYGPCGICGKEINRGDYFAGNANDEVAHIHCISKPNPTSLTGVSLKGKKMSKFNVGDTVLIASKIPALDGTSNVYWDPMMDKCLSKTGKVFSVYREGHLEILMDDQTLRPSSGPVEGWIFHEDSLMPVKTISSWRTKYEAIKGIKPGSKVLVIDFSELDPADGVVGRYSTKVAREYLGHSAKVIRSDGRGDVVVEIDDSFVAFDPRHLELVEAARKQDPTTIHIPYDWAAFPLAKSAAVDAHGTTVFFITKPDRHEHRWWCKTHNWRHPKDQQLPDGVTWEDSLRERPEGV